MASAVANSFRACAIPKVARTLAVPAAQKFTMASSPILFRSAAKLGPVMGRSSTRVAAFHTSKKMEILPAGPQVIIGDVNEPTPIPESNPVHGSYHWSFERLISIALIPLTIAPFAAGSLNPVTDAILGATLVIHSHIGFESIIIDYIPKRTMPRIHGAFRWGLKATTLAVLLGLYEFQTNDVGLTQAVKRVWTA
ncbi:CybS-domain-containing protein [Peziza echinospora]|nr:CybS-domain-containing protein [Peziza echinospora]